MAPPTHSKRGPLRRTPVSVVFPEGPEIVHCEADAVREELALQGAAAQRIRGLSMRLPGEDHRQQHKTCSSHSGRLRSRKL